MANKTILKRSPKKDACYAEPQSGLTKAKYKQIHVKKEVKKTVLKVGSRRETSLPHIEYPVASGNYDTSRLAIKNVVLHTTVSSFESAATSFNTVGRIASSTYIIKLDGTIVLMLEEYYTPYTNGNYTSNQQSITIEHVDNGDYNGPRTPALYAASAKLVRDICNFYGLPINRTTVKKHNEISQTACPDSLDVDRIVREAAGVVPAPTPNYTQAAKDSAKAVYGYQVEGTVTQRMAVVVDAFKRNNVPKP